MKTKSYSTLQEHDIHVPDRPILDGTFKNCCVEFIRYSCQGLNYTGEPAPETGTSHDFNCDVDRLCLENAVVRFLNSGTRDAAFDVYVSYCEIFKPFGAGYDSTRCLVELLAEHEENSSSLLMKHRDHYSHSVYVYLMGLCVFQNNPTIRQAYTDCYQLSDGPQACNHFLEYWGIASLFHDIGYPFEIAHQQMKVYACILEGIESHAIDSVNSYSPFISYRRIDHFAQTDMGGTTVDLNDFFAQAIAHRIGEKYGISQEELAAILKDRAVNEVPEKGGYLYMDHAYFSGLIATKKYAQGHPDQTEIPKPVLDALVAIILHNSLFKFSIRKKSPGLSIGDGQPLAYLLMLCDELQCWNRTSYGQNSRNAIFPYEFDMAVTPETGTISATYYFDSALKKGALGSKSHQSLTYADGHCKFVDDIQKIIDVQSAGILLEVTTAFSDNIRKKHAYASNTSYLNIYDFALALNGRYDKNITMTPQSSDQDILDKRQAMVASFEQLSLEFKLSNIAQAKEFAIHLEAIDCFYTDAETDYPMLEEFTEEELAHLARLEHSRWQAEKESMGWVYGTDYSNGAERAKKRHHKDMVPFEQLNHEDILKDSEPMRMMVRLLKLFDGLSIYRMNEENN